MMPEPSIPQRLQRLLRDGNLTVSDLARWLGRPIPTVNGWVKGGTIGRLPPHDLSYLTSQLWLLERRMSRKDGLPIPPMSMRERKDYVTKLLRSKGA